MATLQGLLANPEVTFILILLALYPAGLTGLWVRKGVETRKGLKNIREQLEQQGYTVNDNWRKKYRRTFLYIWGPILGWVIVYIVIFKHTTLWGWLYSLLGLIIPIFGYHGKLFWPTVEE